MNKTIIFILLILIIVYGCTASSKNLTFDKGVKKINEIDRNYGATLKVPPETAEEIDGLLAQLIGFKVVNENIPKPLEFLLDFKIKFLKTEKLHVEGWQWGRASTTEFGFGCKRGYARVSEAARLRNMSAQTGFETVDILQSFVDNYPQESKSLQLAVS